MGTCLRFPAALLVSTLLIGVGVAQAEGSRRAIAIADSIEMRKFGSETFDEAGPILRSPNGSRYAFVVRNGVLEANHNVYTLFVFDAPRTKRSVPSDPREILQLTSSSNEASIQNLTWTQDSEYLVFLGDAGDGHRRVHRLRVADRAFESLTPPNVDVLTYAISEDSSTIAYIAQTESRRETTVDGQTGTVLGSVNYWELTEGRSRSVPRIGEEIVVLRGGQQHNYPLPFSTNYSAPSLVLSPDGSQLLVQELPEIDAGQAPAHWAPLFGRGWAVAANYWVISTDAGGARRVLDATIGEARGLAWTGNSTVAFGTKLPVGEGDPEKHYTIEMDLRQRTYQIIATGWFDQLEWSSSRQILSGKNDRERVDQVLRGAYIKRAGTWRSTSIDPTISVNDQPFVEQGMNLPPRLVWQSANGSKRVLLDPNPQLKEISWREGREIEIPLRDGKRFKTTLYLPEGWRADGAYPAVLQTYYRDPARFTLDGNSMTSGMSAQALVAKGFVVVQLDLPDTIYPETIGTPDEARVGAAVYDEVVGELVRNYGVDPTRVGIFGFSRSGLVTRYALANTKTYAAAIQADSFYTGYVARILLHDTGRVIGMDPIIGAPPTGEGLRAWLEHAAAFAAHRVTAPLLVMNFGQWSDLMSIEEKVTMELAKRPAEFVVFPTALHNPVKPAERFSVQSRYVDWFRYWLQDYEDPDPKKADQYQRWRKLREQRDLNRALAQNNYSAGAD